MDKILQLIKEEEKRQRETLMMIPSENYTYPEVREALGSVLMHKYAEGQPKKRYYQGFEFVDQIELICEERALQAFDLDPEVWGVNVQPYSGTPANLAIYNTFLEPGDKIMAMYLPDGGHLSHGWEYKGKKITLSSKIWRVEFYKVDAKTKVFDYDKIEEQAMRFKPKLLISGGTAYPREIDHKKMAEIAHKAGAYYLADIAHEAGLVAAGVNKSPFPYADAVTMTTHKTLRGPRGALAFVKRENLAKLDAAIFPGLQGGPHLHTIAGIAIALEKAKSKEFKEYAKQTVKNAQALAKQLMDYEFDVVSEGTDKHLILVDLRNMEINGWFAAWALEYAGIIVNRNTVPYETGSPYYPSGIRLGTPAITARGMKEKEMNMIGEWIATALNHLEKVEIPEDSEKRSVILREFKEKMAKDKILANINEQVKDLCLKFSDKL